MSLQVEFVKNPFTEALFPLFGTLNKTTSTLHLNLESGFEDPFKYKIAILFLILALVKVVAIIIMAIIIAIEIVKLVILIVRRIIVTTVFLSKV